MQPPFVNTSLHIPHNFKHNIRDIRSAFYTSTKDSWPPSLFAFITLITYQFSLLPFACLACLCASLCSRTLVSPLPYPVCWLINIRDSVFLRFLYENDDYFLSFLRTFFVFFYPSFFNFPPPCLVSHFSLFTLLFTLPDFLQQLASPACLHSCLFVLASVSLRPYGWVGLKGFCVLFATPREGRQVSKHKPSAPYPDARARKFSSPIPGYIRDRKRKGPDSLPQLVLQPLYLPPVPVVVETINPNGPFRLRAVVITDPSLRPLL